LQGKVEKREKRENRKIGRTGKAGKAGKQENRENRRTGKAGKPNKQAITSLISILWCGEVLFHVFTSFDSRILVIDAFFEGYRHFIRILLFRIA